jgi:hypothetical protein
LVWYKVKLCAATLTSVTLDQHTHSHLCRRVIYLCAVVAHIQFSHR